MRFADTTWLVLGLARSGCAAGALLRRHGARAVGVDDAPRDRLEAQWRQRGLDGLIDDAFDAVLCGPDGAADLPPFDGVVLSPGVPTRRALDLAAGRPVLGELELAGRFCAARSVVITGTNGKTTTTELTAHLLRTAGLDARALGNVGRPFADVADTLPADAVAVLEASSFQLETVDTLRPVAGAVLNLAPDHLDRYPDLDAYYAAKRRLCALVRDDGLFVTWTGCPEALAWDCGRRTLFGDPLAGADYYAADGWLIRRGETAPRAVLALEDMPLDGAPNVLNACAALALTEPFGLDDAVLAAGLRTFSGLRHRQEVVARGGGLVFVNDTKATNVHAVCAGLGGYDADVVLILGGSGKGEDYAPLRAALGPVKHVVLIGREGPAIGAALEGTVSLETAGSLDDAVERAAAAAGDRGTVLLSPACASFDMFRDYGHRGEVFAAAALAWVAGREGRTP